MTNSANNTIEKLVPYGIDDTIIQEGTGVLFEISDSFTNSAYAVYIPEPEFVLDESEDNREVGIDVAWAKIAKLSRERWSKENPY